MNKKVLIAVVLVLVLAIAGGAAYFLFLKPTSDKNAEPTYYTYDLGDSFVTNVKDSSKLFKATIVIVSTDAKFQTTLDAKKNIARDTVLFLLRDLTEEDIDSRTIQDSLRTQIADALNKSLDVNSITSVYFSDFVMQ